MKKLALVVGLLVAGCSAPQAVQLRDPQTKQLVECKADPWAVWSWDIARWNDDCAKKYERNGFERIK